MTSMMQTFDWRGAMEICTKVLQDDPDHLGALETLAKAQWLGGQYTEVILTTNRLLRLNPHEPGYRYTRGMAYLSMGRLRQSADDLRMAYGQSKDAAFKGQVGSALEAVELWMADPQTSTDRRAAVGAFAPAIGSSLMVH
jgi:tetratricopeptide (TPR) repeat protein